VEKRIQAEIDKIAFPAPVEELLNSDPDNALKDLFVAGITGTSCHYPVDFLSLV